MSELLNKLSSYNLFNYLLPGTVFVAVAESTTHYRFTHDNILISAFVYYFIGLVISRLGSLFVEPSLKWVGFVRFAPYRDFVKACAEDPKIEVLSEQNNGYRTLCALFVALPLWKLFDVLHASLHLENDWWVLVAMLLLALLFAAAYRKQTNYITQRIER